MHEIIDYRACVPFTLFLKIWAILLEFSLDSTHIASQVSENGLIKVMFLLKIIDHITEVLNFRVLITGANLILESFLEDALHNLDCEIRSLVGLDALDQTINVLQLNIHGLNHDDIGESKGCLVQS
jgi:hypothetical protein